MNVLKEFDARCPWQKVCSCTHKGCVGGWLPDRPGKTELGNDSAACVKRCPVCDAARRNLPFIPPLRDDAARLAAGERLEIE